MEQISGLNEAAVIFDRLIKLGVEQNCVHGIISDKGADIVGKHKGFITALGSMLGNELNSVLCDLHAINWCFRTAMYAAYGVNTRGKPHIIQLAHCVSYLMDQDWMRFKHLLEVVAEAEDLTKMDIPLLARWYTVVNALRYFVFICL